MPVGGLQYTQAAGGSDGATAIDIRLCLTAEDTRALGYHDGVQPAIGIASASTRWGVRAPWGAIQRRRCLPLRDAEPGDDEPSRGERHRCRCPWEMGKETRRILLGDIHRCRRPPTSGRFTPSATRGRETQVSTPPGAAFGDVGEPPVCARLGAVATVPLLPSAGR